MSRIDLVKTIIVSLCISVLVIVILMNFINQNKNKSKVYKKSPVETGSMFGFFFVYYIVLLSGLGNIELREPTNIITIIIGLIIIVFGTYVNVTGRISLGKNWANQIKIYDNHRLVTTGLYKYLRHPLYASLIWMFYAGGLIYTNYALLILNTVIFIPFMIYRAKQEEKELSKEYPEYDEYKQKVGMFFPTIGGRR